MEFNQCSYIDIGHSIAVCETEYLFILHVRQDSPKPPTCHCLGTSIDQGHTPRFGAIPMIVRAVLRQIKGHIGRVQKVVGKKLLDHVALVPKANNEIVNPVGRIDLHDMPKDRLTANLDHWLRA